MGDEWEMLLALKHDTPGGARSGRRGTGTDRKSVKLCRPRCRDEGLQSPECSYGDRGNKVWPKRWPLLTDGEGDEQSRRSSCSSGVPHRRHDIGTARPRPARRGGEASLQE